MLDKTRQANVSNDKSQNLLNLNESIIEGEVEEEKFNKSAEREYQKVFKIIVPEIIQEIEMKQPAATKKKGGRPRKKPAEQLTIEESFLS